MTDKSKVQVQLWQDTRTPEEGNRVLFRLLGDKLPTAATVGLGRSGGCPTPLGSLWLHDSHSPAWCDEQCQNGERDEYVKRVVMDVELALASGADVGPTAHKLLKTFSVG